MPAIDPDQFAAYLIMAEKADNTIRNYRAMFIRWCDWAIAHGRDPYRPDPLAVRAWGATINGTKSSLAHARATIGHLCAALGVEDVSPAIPLPREPRRNHRALHHHQAVALVQQAHQAGLKGTAVLVALYTTARRSEVASLSWHRIMFDIGQVTLVRPKTRDLHTVPLHPVLAEHLEQRRTDGEKWVFPGRYGGHLAPATIWRYVLDVAEAAGVGHVTPHQLRHTSLTEAYDATGDLRAVQDLAGHTDPAVTARYTRTSERRLAAAVAALDYSSDGATSLQSSSC
ncbi:MAG: site-specific integrase [Chloroflexi bacterium]|nr:site-specific integrase [Chloroflexota bacterium]